MGKILVIFLTNKVDLSVTMDWHPGHGTAAGACRHAVEAGSLALLSQVKQKFCRATTHSSAAEKPRKAGHRMGKAPSRYIRSDADFKRRQQRRRRHLFIGSKKATHALVASRSQVSAGIPCFERLVRQNLLHTEPRGEAIFCHLLESVRIEFLFLSYLGTREEAHR